jgi:hypothetical protein
LSTSDLDSGAVPVEERARPVGAAHRFRPTAPVVALAALVVAAFVLILYLDRGVGFYFDEWNFVLERQGIRSTSS